MLEDGSVVTWGDNPEVLDGFTVWKMAPSSHRGTIPKFLRGSQSERWLRRHVGTIPKFLKGSQFGKWLRRHVEVRFLMGSQFGKRLCRHLQGIVWKTSSRGGEVLAEVLDGFTV